MGLFNFFKKNQSNTLNEINDKKVNSNETLDEFTQDMLTAANHFVDRSINRYKGLVFSVNSLVVVDYICENAIDVYPDLTEVQKNNFIRSVGAYVFEVARQNFGGKYYWYDALNQPILVTGQPEFEASILAFDKVEGRLVKGKEDNIPFYFAGYVEKVKAKQSALIV